MEAFAAQDFAKEGFVIIPRVLTEESVADLTRATAPLLEDAQGRGGVRHLLRDIPEVRALADSSQMRAIAEAALGSEACAVRGIMFDKSPQANWKVIWHQDLTIAVQEGREVEGFGPWSKKDGVPHVQPPINLLKQMVAVRLHLDDCTADNGPVRVIPRSHRAGRLGSEEITTWRARSAEVKCTVPRGGVLAFHSLLLHASSPARQPSHRRVVHLEYVGREWRQLPGGLQWYEMS